MLMRRLRLSFALTLVLTGPLPASAQTTGDSHHWLVQTSVYTIHFKSGPDLNDRQWLIDVEHKGSRGPLFGVALFSNSFKQPCQYVYIGKIWKPLRVAPGFFLKLTGGVLHGYEGEHREEIPFNGSGVAIVAVPSIGFKTGRFQTEVVVFGIAGAMVTVGASF